MPSPWDSTKWESKTRQTPLCQTNILQHLDPKSSTHIWRRNSWSCYVTEIIRNTFSMSAMTATECILNQLMMSRNFWSIFSPWLRNSSREGLDWCLKAMRSFVFVLSWYMVWDIVHSRNISSYWIFHKLPQSLFLMKGSYSWRISRTYLRQEGIPAISSNSARNC